MFLTPFPPDARDAEHLLDLLRTGRFPRIWVPSEEERDLLQLLVYRLTTPMPL